MADSRETMYLKHSEPRAQTATEEYAKIPRAFNQTSPIYKHLPSLFHLSAHSRIEANLLLPTHRLSTTAGVR